MTKPTVFIVAGCSGSGKSWVCKQVLDHVDYVSYDSTRSKDHITRLLLPSTKPKLYDPPIKVSTFFKRYSDKFNIRAVFILETDETVKDRIKNRGGMWTESISKRNKVMIARAKKYGEFSGTSDQVLEYLKTKMLNLTPIQENT